MNEKQLFLGLALLTCITQSVFADTSLTFLRAADNGELETVKKNFDAVTSPIYRVRALELSLDRDKNYNKNNGNDVAKFLLEKGVDVSMKGLSGKTPLMLTAKSDNVDIVRILLVKPGSTLYTKDKEGKTALDLATGTSKKLIQDELDKINKRLGDIINTVHPIIEVIAFDGSNTLTVTIDRKHTETMRALIEEVAIQN